MCVCVCACVCVYKTGMRGTCVPVTAFLASWSHTQPSPASSLAVRKLLKLRTNSGQTNYPRREMVRTWFQVKYGIQCLPVVGNLLIQPREVELILNVVLIHLWDEEGGEGEGGERERERERERELEWNCVRGYTLQPEVCVVSQPPSASG